MSKLVSKLSGFQLFTVTGTLCLTLLSAVQPAYSQEVSQSDPKQSIATDDRVSPYDEVKNKVKANTDAEQASGVKEESGFLKRIGVKFVDVSKAVYNTVRFDFAVSMDDDKKVNLVRMDILAAVKMVGGKLRVSARVNATPYLIEGKVREYLNANPDIIAGAAAKIAKTLNESVALKLGVPVQYVKLSIPEMSGILQQSRGKTYDEFLADQVSGFVDSRITEEAKLNALLRSAAVSFDVIGVAGETDTVLTLEVGKLENLLAGNNSYITNPAQVQTAFRLSRPGYRVKYETAGAGGLTIALEVANDAGVGSLYNPEANVGIQFISNLIQRQRGKFFDFRDVNSWEVTVIKSLPGSMLYLAAGERPFLNDVDGVNSPKKDSRYIVARFDAKLGEYSIDVGGNLEKVNSKVLGEVTVHTVESGVARSFGKTQVGARALYRMGHVPREQFTALYLGANRAIFDFGDVTVGGAVRGSAHRLNAPDSKWNLGAEVGAAIFNNPASSLDQIKSRNDAAENAKRLRAEKKNEKKAKNK